MKQATRNRLLELVEDSPISAVDLFCGAGGLTYGLMQAGIRVEAGIDIDEQAGHAYRTNNGGIPRDIAKDYAFKMGRDPDDDRDANNETIGMYGVGMKRAIFKDDAREALLEG